MYGGWDKVEETDVERTASSVIRMPLPPPDESDDDFDLEAPTLPRAPRLAAGTGPVLAIPEAPEPLTPRWAVIAIGVLAATAVALATALAFG